MAQKKGAKTPKGKAERGVQVVRGERVRKLRTDLGLKQLQLAHAADCQVMTISALENSKGDVRAGTLVRICRVLDCSADYLLGLSDSPKSSK